MSDWDLGGDYDAWKTTPPEDEDEEELDEESIGDLRYHEKVDMDIMEEER